MTSEKFDYALLKVWFVGAATSRNFAHVVLVERENNIMTITNNSGSKSIVNFDNVTMIEELHV